MIILENCQNADEFIHLLDLFECTNFYVQARRWNNCDQCTPEFCQGRVGDAVDSIYYEAWRRCTVSDAEGTRLANALSPDIPDDHSIYLPFDVIPDGWESNAQAVVNNREFWDDDAAIGDVNDDHTGGVGPSDARRIIFPQGDLVDAQRVDAHEDENGVGDVCASVADVVRRLLTKVGSQRRNWVNRGLRCMVRSVHIFL